MRVLDLCCGLGGASEAFVRAGDEVTRVDNDPRFAKVPFTVIADVRTFDEGVDWDVILASPPCGQFSKVRRMFGGPIVNPDLSIVNACFAVRRRHPRAVFILENACHLKDFIGPPACRRGARYFWGDVGILPTGTWNKWGGSWEPSRPSYVPKGWQTGSSEDRARWPLPISEAVRHNAAVLDALLVAVTRRSRSGVG
ncbi:MAG: DNA cytosine methyltransferase [Thermoplasmata archaeon]|nr:DNA cytosine methyltransferase [Thermoplasmata archaeon]